MESVGVRIKRSVGAESVNMGGSHDVKVLCGRYLQCVIAFFAATRDYSVMDTQAYFNGSTAKSCITVQVLNTTTYKDPSNFTVVITTVDNALSVDTSSVTVVIDNIASKIQTPPPPPPLVMYGLLFTSTLLSLYLWSPPVPSYGPLYPHMVPCTFIWFPVPSYGHLFTFIWSPVPSYCHLCTFVWSSVPSYGPLYLHMVTCTYLYLHMVTCVPTYGHLCTFIWSPVYLHMVTCVPS